ncbi:MAG: SDR family oxidoreductase [Pseudomonadota bacterium]
MTSPLDPNEQRMARALQAIERLQSRLQAVESAAREPIAIVGVGCRFPGGADDAASFWSLLAAGHDAIGPVPADRWDAQALHDSDPATPGRIVSREGGFVPDPQYFDAAFFGISPKEAATLDPQQRLLLETAWQGMEHAGFVPADWQGRQVGVFVGISSHDYSHRLLMQPAEQIDAYLATGNAHSVAAGRLSYTWGFTGPSIVVDTACSSSLVAVHQACQSLRAGECDAALAAGVNRILSPAFSINFSRARMLSPDGRCKAFSAQADGFGRGEGAGVIVLKRLRDAQAAGDRILAVIRGSAVNQDGRSGGLTVPNGPAQQAVIRKALAQAGLGAGDVDYIEAHGTGTALGDPIEAGALGEVFAASHGKSRPLLVGSVKTNVGHLEAAAGICGLIKVALSLDQGHLPAQLHAAELSPHIDWSSLPVEIVREARAWPKHTGRVPVAGVSSFGFSGTNAHVVLAGRPVSQADADTQPPDDQGADVLMLSARDEASLRTVAQDCHTLLVQGARWADLCWSARHLRSRFPVRHAVVAADAASAGGRLQAWLRAQGASAGQPMAQARPRIAFLFTGQGAQWAGMGRQLYEREPVFRLTFDEVADRFKAHGLDLRALLWGDRAAANSEDPDAQAALQARLDRTEFAQPALLAIACALTRWWQAAGVQPDVVIGHSVGELAACVCAGLLSLDQAVSLVLARGQLMQSAPGEGAMVALPVSADALGDWLAKEPSLVIAGLNAPDRTVLAGPLAAVERTLAHAQAQGWRAVRLAVSHAFHSPLMAPVREALDRQADALLAQGQGDGAASQAQCALVSTVTGQVLGQLPAGYWGEQLVSPVRFHDALARAVERGCTHFIEIGPQPHLCALGARGHGQDGRHWLPSMRPGPDARQPLAEALAALHTAGFNIQWPGDQGRRIDLPHHPMQRTRHWVESAVMAGVSHRDSQADKASHPLLGRLLQLADEPGQRHEARLAPVGEDVAPSDQAGWLVDHTVFDHIVMPAAGYLEMALAMGESLAAQDAQEQGGRGWRISGVLFRQALLLQAPRRVQSRLVPSDASPQGEMRWRVFSSPEAPQAAWTLHAEGSLQSGGMETSERIDLHQWRRDCLRPVDPEACWHRLAAQGVAYGPAFRAIDGLWTGDDEVLSHLVLPAGVSASATLLHPILLDGAFQSLAALFLEKGLGDVPPHLPAALDRLHWHGGAHTRSLWCRAKVRRVPGGLLAGFLLVDEQGCALAEIEGLSLMPASAGRLGAVSAEVPNVARLSDALFSLQWQAQPAPQQPRREAPPDLAVLCEPATSHWQDQLATPERQAYLSLLPQLDDLARLYARTALEQVRADEVPARQQALYGRLQQWQAADILPAAIADDDLTLRHAALRQAWPEAATEIDLLQRCGEHLADVLRGRMDPMAVLFGGSDPEALVRLYRDSPGATLCNDTAARLAEALAGIGPATAGRPWRVLEIGAGTGGTTASLLPALQRVAGEAFADRIEYHFTDLSPTLLEQALTRFESVRCQRLDIEQDPQVQGFESGGWDLVVAANVLHATADLRNTLQHARQLLAPGGHLLLLEVTRPLAWLDLVFGLTEGWWRSADTDLRPDHALLSPQAWLSLLRSQDWTQAVCIGHAPDHGHDGADTAVSQHVFIARAGEPSTTDRALPIHLVSHDLSGVPEAWLRGWREQGLRVCLDTPETLSLNASDVLAAERPQVVWVSVAEDMDVQAIDHDVQGLRRLVQRLASMPPGVPSPQLSVVTRGALERPTGLAAPQQSAAWGMARVVALEHPRWACRRIDLDPLASPGEQAACLLQELALPDAEHSVSWHGTQRMVARLDAVVLPGTAAAESSNAAPAWRLHQHTRGLPEALAQVPTNVPAPSEGEVTLRVRAAGLNMIDVLDVLGSLPFERGWLGVECVGEVVAIGQGVTHLREGDLVLALAPGAWASHVTVRTEWVALCPSILHPLEAATLPACYLTAWHALHDVAGLCAGERVLVHAVSGGTGWAAAQVARHLGALVHGTASAGKWAAVEPLGLAQCLNSRDTAYAQAIPAFTQAAGDAVPGVDVVLNALTGEHVPASLACLRPGGRFVELGKREADRAEQVRRLRPDVVYHCVDLMTLAWQAPARIASLFDALLPRWADGSLPPLPRRVLPVSRTVDAVRLMQRAAHVGKVVLELQAPAWRVRAEARYLVTGGLGGLGQCTARWLLEQGARHLVLVGRHAHTDALSPELADLAARLGADVQCKAVDVADATQVQSLIAQLGEAGPPLRGVFHAAGVLEDSRLDALSAERLDTALAPKVRAAWHLHEATRHLPLEAFVLYSSASALLGSPGQGAHVAANAGMDALAQHRRALGLPGLSIQWGPWTDVGAASDAQTLSDLRARGVDGLSPATGIALLSALLDAGASPEVPACVGALSVRWSALGRTPLAADPMLARLKGRMAESSSPQEARRPQTSDLAVPASSVAGDVGAGASTDQARASAQQALMALPDARRRPWLVRALQDEVAVVLGQGGTARPDAHLGFFEMGMDSLMAVELRTRVARRLGITLPTSGVFEFPTIDALAGHLLTQLCPSPPADEAMSVVSSSDAPAPAVSERPAEPVASIDSAKATDAGESDPALDEALARELAALDALLNKP